MRPRITENGVTGLFENETQTESEYKLTLLDEGRNGFAASLKMISKDEATIIYSGAARGENEYISVIIKNGDDVKYYGRVAKVSDTSGEVSFELPEDFSLANGDAICVFNEQYNGDYDTDYASDFVEIASFEYKVDFDANGGEGTMPSQTMTVGVEEKISANAFTKNGYKFEGWNTKADGTGMAYTDGQSVMSFVFDEGTSAVTLYAQWKDETAPVIFGVEDGKTYCGECQITISDNDEIANVTVNNKVVTLDEGKYICHPMEGAQTIVATDKEGNQTSITITINDGHTYEWKNENGQYWERCKICGDETEKKELTEIIISGADKICKEQEYVFTIILPENVVNATYSYNKVARGSIRYEFDVVDGIYTGKLPINISEGGGTFVINVFAETLDGYHFTTSKTIEIQSEHSGGIATCEDKAHCDVCGEEYGEIDSENHISLTHFESKAATTEAEGNIEYWCCDGCDKYFSDKEGKTEITLADTIIEKQTQVDENKDAPVDDEGKDAPVDDEEKKNETKPVDKVDIKLPDTDDSRKAPETGDHSHMVLWLGLLAVSGCGALGVILYRRKKNRK